MIFLYFSCRTDEKLLAASVASLKRICPEARVFVANDKRDRASIPPGCTEVLTSFDRGGTGNGLAAIEGELMTMQHLLNVTGKGYVVKIDSDVWVNSTDSISPKAGEVEADFLGYESARMLMPACGAYRLSKWAVQRALTETRRRWRAGEWTKEGIYAENMVIFKLVCLVPTLRARLVPYTAGKLVGMHDDGCGQNQRAHHADFVHCGELLQDGTRARREHVFMRMSLLQSEQK